MSKHEPTTTDILEAIHSFSSDVDKRFDGIDKRFEGIDKRFENIDKRFNNVDKRFEGIENDLRIVKSTMVTKAYLDEKLLDLRGDMTVLIRKEDNKVKELVNILVKKKIVTKEEQKKLFKMEPFAQTFL